jgi:DNA-binding Lrp family transcriptional regulator
MSSNLIYLQVVRKKKSELMELNARRYSQFQSVEEMNGSINRFLDDHGSDLRDTALILLAVLAQHSCVAAGVSWLSVRSMSALIGVTERTIQSALKSLESTGIIKRIATTTHNGGQGNNYIVIQQYGTDTSLEYLAVQEIAASCMQTAAGTENFTGGITRISRGSITEDFTQNYINYQNSFNLNILDDDDLYKHNFRNYRHKFYFETAAERNIPLEIAQSLLQYIDNQIMTTSWTALGAAFCKLKEHARGIGSMGPWFAETLRNENMLCRITS